MHQKCIHLRHNLFAPILLLCHLFVQPMGIICAIVINLLFYLKDIYFKETYLMASLLFYPGLGLAILTLAELKSFIIKYWFLGCAGWSFLLSLYIDWRTYLKSFFSKFSSSILKSSELMIFEGRSDIISTEQLVKGKQWIWSLKVVLISYPLLSFYKLFSKSVVLVLRICLMYMVQFTT